MQRKPCLIASAIVASWVVAGCAASSGILPVGPNTYTVTERYAPIRGGSLTAQQTALTEANEFCTQQGRQFFSYDMMTLAGITTPNSTGYSVTFRCLQPGDPALSPPSTIIELRNR